MVFSLVWDKDSYTECFLCCFHTYMYYKPNWFISTSPLYSSLVPFPSGLSQFRITIFVSIQWAHQPHSFLVFFPYPIPPMHTLPLVWPISNNITAFVIGLYPHMRENIQFLAFWVWLTSLKIMFSSSIHLPASDIISFFLWLSKIPLCINTTFS
jgi:hypothetical protein